MSVVKSDVCYSSNGIVARAKKYGSVEVVVGEQDEVVECRYRYTRRVRMRNRPMAAFERGSGGPSESRN
jgi:hypothetical protein